MKLYDDFVILELPEKNKNDNKKCCGKKKIS
jgi:hypothetical protein